MAGRPDAVVRNVVAVANAVCAHLVVETVVHLHRTIRRMVDCVPEHAAVVSPDQQNAVVKRPVDRVPNDLKINATIRSGVTACRQVDAGLEHSRHAAIGNRAQVVDGTAVLDAESSQAQVNPATVHADVLTRSDPAGPSVGGVRARPVRRLLGLGSREIVPVRCTHGSKVLEVNILNGTRGTVAWVQSVLAEAHGKVLEAHILKPAQVQHV